MRKKRLMGKFSTLMAELERSVPTHTSTHAPTPTHTHAPSPAHTQAPTPAHTDAPTPPHTHAPTPPHTDAPTPPHTSPTPPHTHAPTPAHTDAPTPPHTDAPTPAHTHAPTPADTSAPTVAQLHLLVQQLSNDNVSLKDDVAELTRRCNRLSSELSDVKSQLARITAAPRAHHMNVRRGWHEQANVIIGASHSRATPTHSYRCAHAGCDWRNKKVTLQAYVLHLKRKHGINISDNPDLSLLPVLSR